MPEMSTRLRCARDALLDGREGRDFRVFESKHDAMALAPNRWVTVEVPVLVNSVMNHPDVALVLAIHELNWKIEQGMEE
ncbi:hypothetical protein FE257_000053 [Aspergillus nanangensis]|uniref:Uncharacterized protein n=1 Tax=Aspergillus nanangensis TaxID=2582783 RepID=A0AAD4GZN4_ASPNN|nr:hypothetical protein FE257_000053 [Aspergillus nanangensis]